MDRCKLKKGNWPSILGSSTAEGDCNNKKKSESFLQD